MSHSPTFAGALAPVLDAPDSLTINQNRRAGFLLTTLNCTFSESVNFQLLNRTLDFLQVHPTSGELSLTMDAENVQIGTYRVGVECFSPTSPLENSQANFDLIRAEENEFLPTFVNDSLAVSISESTPTTVSIGQVRASDGDVGTYGQIIYSIATPAIGSLFSIRPDTGIITLGSSLDYEQDPVHQFLVSACNPPLRAGVCATRPVLVRVSVTDIDDTSPIFDLSNYAHSLLEDYSGPANFLNVSCTDRDTDDARIRYGISGDSRQPFQLNQENGQLSVAGSLDYETTVFYTFTVVCFDNSTLNSSSTATVEITILPVNDNRPRGRALGFPAIFLNESSPVGSIIASTSPNITSAYFRFEDADSGPDGNVTYTFPADAILMEFFSIDLITGEVTIKRQLDFDANTSLTRAAFGTVAIAQLRITGCDEFPPNRDCPNVAILMYIFPLNEFAPQFSEEEYHISVLESLPLSDIVIQISCTDRDLVGGNFMGISFINASESVLQKFGIESNTGVIRLLEALDYESTQNYGFHLVCRDTGGLEARTLVTIEILPVNEYAPSFIQAFYHFNVSRTTPSNRYPIGRVSATDRDVGFGGDLNYGIQSNPYFGIAEDGNILLVNSIQNASAGEIGFNVIVRDGPNSTFNNGTAYVVISFTDGNMNRPEFQLGSRTIVISELLPMGSTITTVTCTDNEAGLNGIIRYSIQSGNSDNVFDVNSISGAISATSVLTLPQNTSRIEYPLIVVCEDLGVPRLSNLATIFIRVIQDDSSPPVFSDDVIFAFVNEDAPLNTHIITINATDLDTDFLVFALENESHPGVFLVDPPSGLILLSASLDRETVSAYTMTVTVTEQRVIAGPDRSDRAFLTILVRDVNDNAPTCNQSGLVVTIPDTTLQGEEILTLNCSDPDVGINGNLTYSLVDNFNVVGINNTGTVYFTGSIESVDRNILVLEVRVSDQGLPLPQGNSYHVTIRISSTNHNIPVFLNLPSTIIVPESHPLQEVVFVARASDPDRGSFGQLSYSIIDGPESDRFEIIPNTGSILLRRRLNFFEQQVHTLNISVEDTDNVVTELLRINVTDVNEFVPSCEETRITMTLPEAIHPDQLPLLRLSCIDRDQGPNGELTYTIVMGDDEGIFAVNGSGVVSAQQTLDFEMEQRHSLLILVADGGDPPLALNVSVTVVVQAVNEFAPTFTETLYTATIPENSVVGTSVLTVTATDNDLATHSDGQIMYSIIGLLSPYFSVSSSGLIQVVGDLDRESREVFSFMIRANDRSIPPMSGSVLINITLSDVDDNPPVFNQSIYSVALNQNANSQDLNTTIQCDDQDSGSNAAVVYSLDPRSDDSRFFQISNSGTIRVNGTLAISRTYSISVVCRGPPPNNRSDSATVIIEAVVNSTISFHPSSSYTRNISENTVPVFDVLTISASLPNNTPLTYTLLSETSFFRIDSSTGILRLVSNLDYETEQSFVVRVQASDGGNPPNLAEAVVNILVENVNDETPIITTAPPVLNLTEGPRVETEALLDLECTDADDGSFGDVTFRIVGGDVQNSFAISTSGSLSRIGDIDYETTTSVSLDIICEDGGTPRLSDSVTLSINVLPVNDNPPIFPMEVFIVRVDESVPVGRVIGNLTAMDADLPPHNDLRYSILTGSVIPATFEIMPTTGGLILMRSLDFETTQTYSFTLLVEDSGGDQDPEFVVLNDTATIRILIIDENDNPPVLSRNAFTGSIFEEAGVGAQVTVVGTISCTDADSGNNGATSLSIPDPTFEIDPTGSIVMATRNLNFENQTSYTLSIRCTDQGSPQLSAVATLFVTVIDVNEFSPRFINESGYVFSVLESSIVGNEIGSILAVDEDAGDAGIISYSFVNGSGAPFTLNAETGAITLSRSLDFENQPHQYVLQAVASDRANNSNEATVIIRVINVDDHLPTFSTNVYFLFIRENAAMDASVGRLSCSDGDNTALDVPVVYSSISTSPFTVDSQSGEITVVGPLDLEGIPRYSIRVMCMDVAGNTALANVTIDLLPFNDNRPVFIQSQYNVSVIENTPSGTSLLRVTATDDDLLDYNTITYSIVEGNSARLFLMDPRTGDLRINGSIDREMALGHMLEVLARNVIPANDASGSSSLSSTARIFVTVLDVNDNSPVITPRDPPPVFILESDGPSASVIRLTCSDADNGRNGTTSFRITSPGSSERFQISSDGLLRTRMIIRTNEVITVSCYDAGTPPQSSSVGISVNTMSINDHPPMFDNANYSIRVAEDTAVGETVTCINATDRDTADTPDGIIEYSLRFLGSGLSKFRIGVDTGCIFVSIALDFDVAMVFEYEIIAEDMGVAPLRGNATLVIEITDAVRDPPRFSTRSHTSMVPESIAPGSPIVQTTCIDPDVNDTLTYSILDTTSVFVIDPQHGNISTAASLDFETTGSHTLQVACTDSFGLRDRAEVIVSVLPINEYIPTFFSNLADIEENSVIGREVATLVWMDSDRGEDGEVTFSILSGNTNGVFSITPEGTVLVRGSLNREAIPVYNLNISISDLSMNDPRTSSGWLNVTILDVNDNRPRFSTDPYMFGPLEGNETIGHSVGRVSCTDDDVGTNAAISFRISPANVNFTLFDVDAMTGVVRVNGDLRDREVDTVAFTVLCIDSGIPPLAGSTRVLVRVEEINRHPPEFLNSSYFIEIPEDTDILTETILTVHAEDEDMGINGQVTYFLLDTFDGRFFLNERSGELTLIRPLDFEERSQYMLLAIAMDGAEDSTLRLRSAVTIMVQVTGVNEHIPRCLNAIYIGIINITSQGRFIELSCTDDDEGQDGQLTYSIISGNEDGYFMAENDSLLVPTPFRPADGTEQFMLQVLVRDLGEPSRSVTIDVVILYSFDNLAAPEFAQSSYSIDVRELTEVGIVVARLMATDADPSIQGQITYSVLNSDNFRIDANTGNLFVATPLDWETAPFLSFNVMAQDRDPSFPRFDITTVNVTVVNGNDNPPQCDRIFYTGQIPSNASHGDTVLSLSCSDLDTNPLRYSIQSETAPFNVDPLTGRVFVAGPLTDTSYLIGVVVSGNDTERILVSVSIAILFSNLNPPRFDEIEYVFFVSENAQLLTRVGLVRASDSDSETNDLTFSVVNPGMGEFYVNPSSGDVVLTVPLDFETVRQYQFTVQVSDGGSFDGSNVLSSTAMVTINVNNTNDNQPMFSNGGIYGRTIHETTPARTSILTVTCTDDDSAPFGSPVIRGGGFEGIPFELVQISTGVYEVRVSDPLSGPNGYLVNITCSDGENQNIEGQIFLFVPEPNAPIFSEPAYEWFVSETVVTGTTFTSVRATSNDQSEITYSIIDGNNDDVFYIEPSTGVISLVVTLDYETQRRHGLIIRAVDEANRESNVLLLVQVLDANDELPLTPPSALFTVRQNEQPGYPIGTVQCIDADANINNTVFNYTFSPVSVQFSVDEFGIVRLERELDNTPVHVLPVVCFDVRDPLINSSGIVTVEVEFVNLNQPAFQFPLYTFGVPEDLEALSILGDPVIATDSDIGSFSQLIYDIEDEQDQFFIESASGRIGLLTALDREVQDFYRFTVIAVDGGPSAAESSRMTGSTTVTVTVEDANDNAPLSDPLSYVQSIMTNHTVLSPVLNINCSDSDLGNNGTVRYSLSPPEIIDNFIIQSNGTILLAQEQPNQAVYSFFAICSDMGSPPMSSSALVTVTVNFIALSAPMFSQEHYNVSILENITVTTSITRVHATPSDASITIVYSLAEGDERNNFFVNPVTGEVTVRNPLDARVQQNYILSVRAGNVGSNQLFSYATISVFVEDINDNHPIFNSQFYTGTVNESATLLTPVVDVVCRDSDVNNDISYTITGGLLLSSAFNITQDGLILVAREIDYESVTQFSLEVTCSDGGPEPLTAVTTVRIDVSPVNEFSPQFTENEYSFEATENAFGMRIGTIVATDQDSGTQGSVSYLLQDPGNFSVIFVDPSTGEVLISNSLDYETQRVWNLTVIARDGGGLESSALLHIEVLNINDEFPVLEPEAAVSSISVDREVGFPIQSYMCTDVDESDTSLSIFSGNSMNYFTLNSNGILIWTGRGSDLLSNSVVSLILRCIDTAAPDQIDESIIAVSILATDAIVPVFSMEGYSASVAEDTSINTTVVTVSATGENPGLNYSLLSVPLNFPFDINPVSGNITVVGLLNREIEASYSFFVQATDPVTGVPGLVLVEIDIIDINDNPPVITPQMQAFTLQENFTAFSVPFTFFMCTDSDTGANDDIDFQITNGNTLDTFRIDSSGRVYLSRSLDFESITNFTLEITCTDSSISPLSDTAMLIISVANFNEHPPVFTNPMYFFSVSEEAVIGVSVGRVNASDNDTGVDGDIVYSIISTSENFILNEASGELLLARTLNFEVQSNYEITVEARDNAQERVLQMSSTATVMIEVRQANEHTPRCRNAIYIGIINATSEGSILQFSCTDDDEGLDGQLTYSIISGNNDGYFTAENDSLLVPTPFRPADGTEQFMLQVLVRDLGEPSRNVTIDVVITYSFDNLAAPEFAQSSYSIDVRELTEVGTVVARLIATDADPSIQGQITYSVLNSDNFRIDANTGNLFVATPLDWETAPFLSFNVMAQDRDPSFPRFDIATVNVTVVNDNDNPPQCDRMLYTGQIPSNASRGDTVLTLSCTDLDTNPLTYEILSEISLYEIDRNTGRVFVAGLLTEGTSIFSVRISGNDTENINVSVTITALFANRQSPAFNSSVYTFLVSESARLLTPVGSVHATDSDSGEGDLIYSLADPLVGEFHIDPSSGLVVLTVPLDFETVRQYQFTVQVSDEGSFDGSNVLSSTAMVTINVNNTNDNQPMFSNGGIYGRTIHETTPVWTSILTVTCTDDDSAPFNTLSITASEDLESLPFELTGVSPGEAEIRVSEPLSGDNTYFVNITCTDGEQRTDGLVFIHVPEPQSPNFTLPTYEWSVSELADTGSTFTGIRATSDDGSEITYSISDGNDNGIFYMDPSSGDVSLVTSLDYETQTQHVLVVRAVDTSNRRSTVLLLVQVVDANDEVPFIPPSALFTIRQNEQPGHPVGTVECVDADANINNTVFSYLFSPASNRFSIDEFGIIRLVTRLDDIPVHVLPVVCFDVRDPLINSSGIVTVEVEFVNLNRPTFQFPLYTFGVPEDLEALSILGDPVIATDSDIGSFSQLTYNIEGEQDQFFIESASGRIGLLTALDREVQDFYRFTVIAVDGGPSAAESSRMTGSTTVTVTVEDANDNAPLSDPLSYVQSIMTNHTVLSPVLNINCSDSDLGNNGTVRYSLSPPEIVNNFIIQSNGTILLAQEQPNQAVYSFFAICSDMGSPPMSSSALVTVTVNFIALSAPVFSQEHYNVSILENTTVTTSIARVHATPSDASITIVYSLAEGDERNNFFVNPVTGEVTVRNPLDARVQQNYILSIRAGNVGSNQLFSYATVSVFVEDINDNHPIFNSQFYTGTVNESATLLTPVVEVVCRDSDVNNDISYTITGGLLLSSAFNITQDGLILVAGEIDYESVTGYSLEVTCSDGGPEPLTAVTTVRIDVSPVNEFSPQFTENEYSFEATENAFGMHIGTVVATDRDNGTQGSVTYILQDPGNFSVIFVNPTTGEVLVSNSLDYERQRVWNLTVIARDGGGLESSAQLHVVVINVNDVSPVLEPEASVHNISVDQSPNAPIQSYVCNDADGSDTTISLANGNAEGYFELRNNVVLWTGLASNLTTNHITSFTLRCVDNEASEQFDESVIAISIVASDDIVPVFSEETYMISVTEDTEIDIIVLRVSAVGENPGITYSLLNSLLGFPFRVDSIDGNITVVATLNREMESFYSFFVAATDPITLAVGLSLVRISIIDVNDNPPVISPDIQSFLLPENFPLSTSFIVFMCTDSDSGGNGEVAFEITGGNTLDTFSIDSNGRISVSRPLDFEFITNYTLEISCRDSADPPLNDMAVLQITVDGINEDPPIFSNSTYYFSISEYARTGDVVGTVRASDSDAGTDGGISYSVLSGSGMDHFTLNQNGLVTTSILPLNATENAFLQLNIRATDGGGLHSDSAVVVAVEDVNEPPQFSEGGSYFVRASTDLSPGSTVFSFTCYDTDTGNNSVVDLQITDLPPALDLYLLSTGRGNGQDGRLVANSTLPSGSYALRVTCSDEGHPPIASTTSITIRVDSINTPPEFSYNILPLVVPEDITVGSLIFTVNATDAETDVVYRITGGSGLGTFQIDNTTGRVTTFLSLDYEVTSVYILNITAFDLSVSDQMSVSIEVSVIVRNVNDEAPSLFPPGTQAHSLREDAAPMTSITSYTCSDVDGTPTSITISSPDSFFPFEISSTGEVFLQTFVDYEVAIVHSINVTCTDQEVRQGEGVLMRTSTLLRVLVRPVNIHSPVFTSPLLIEVQETANAGDIIGSIVASDEDNRSTVTFSSSSNTDTFQVDTDGNITLVTPLDYELVTEYLLTVTANDNDNAQGVEPRRNTSVIMIRVIDVNDNPPMCVSNVLSTSILTGDYNNDSITLALLNCSDLDNGSNGLLGYSIIEDTLPNTPQGRFVLNNSSGELRFQGSLSASGSHILAILVSDFGDPALNTTVNIVIQIESSDRTRPRFNQTIFQVRISENQLSPSIILSGETIRGNFINPLGGVVVYSLQASAENSGVFVINVATADITLTDSTLVDYDEGIRQYALIIEARVDTVTETAIAEVNVMDFNDNSPGFPRSIYNGTVLENQPPGTFILSIAASDIDSGQNGEFLYSIQDGSLSLNIDPSSGNITTAQRLDREMIERYTIVVLAIDTGVPPLTGSTTVTVSVGDLNDQPPSFIDAVYIVSINNTIQPGQVIVVLRAEDEDEVGNLTFIINDREARGLYLINSEGVIHLRSVGLPQEHRSRYNFTVDVSDGFRSDRATVIIYVVSVTTDTIIFEENIIGETYNARNFLLQNFNISSGAMYEIIEGDPFDEFEIDSNGMLMLTQTLDRENTSRYDLDIRVIDNINSVNVELLITVNVRDQNDNSPVFTLNAYMFNVSEGVYHDSFIFGFVRATDLDQPGTSASTIEYSFAIPDEKFEIISSTGELLVKAGSILDREKMQNFTFLVLARDFGEPSALDTNALLVVSLVDINDNDPEFVPLAVEGYLVLLESDKISPNTTLDKITVLLPKGIRNEVDTITITDPDPSSSVMATLEGQEDGIKFGFSNPQSSELQLIVLGEVTKDDFGMVLQIVLRDQPIDEEDSPVVRNITFVGPDNFFPPTTKGIVPSSPPFFETEAGIAVVVVICLLIIMLMVSLFCLFCYFRLRRDRDPLKDA